MMYTYKVEMYDGSDIEVTAHRVIADGGFVKFYAFQSDYSTAMPQKVAMFPSDRVKAVYALDGDK